jgi:hypothetical protein
MQTGSKLTILPVNNTDTGAYYLGLQPATQGQVNNLFANASLTYNASTGTLTVNQVVVNSGVFYSNGTAFSSGTSGTSSTSINTRSAAFAYVFGG